MRFLIRLFLWPHVALESHLARTGRAPRRPDAPFTLLPIGNHDPRNRRDIGDLLAGEAAEDVLAARLAQAGASPAALTAELAERRGGVWVYLCCVLHELRIGLRRPDEVSALPVGPDSCYADQVRQWQRDPRPAGRAAAAAGVPGRGRGAAECSGAGPAGRPGPGGRPALMRPDAPPAAHRRAPRRGPASRCGMRSTTPGRPASNRGPRRAGYRLPRPPRIPAGGSGC